MQPLIRRAQVQQLWDVKTFTWLFLQDGNWLLMIRQAEAWWHVISGVCFLYLYAPHNSAHAHTLPTETCSRVHAQCMQVLI